MTRTSGPIRQKTAFHLARLAPGLLIAVFAIILWDLLSYVVPPGDALTAVLVLSVILAAVLLFRGLFSRRRPHGES